ncbi:hypothetical protein NDU88_011241 [Pleurodeles waltl]|uniref:Uncharacterized protein n=1 Tax=Pleurodeles waltl TaxID=8319 RepID=A0AAV7R2H0_PLEWA|nr:hypothetical protein NDU88_011241 [Pleurodeles waltl]
MNDPRLRSVHIAVLMLSHPLQQLTVDSRHIPKQGPQVSLRPHVMLVTAMRNGCQEPSGTTLPIGGANGLALTTSRSFALSQQSHCPQLLWCSGSNHLTVRSTVSHLSLQRSRSSQMPLEHPLALDGLGLSCVASNGSSLAPLGSSDP